MKKKKTPENGANKGTPADKPSENAENHIAENCEICEAIKEGKFSVLLADTRNNTPVHNNNGINSKITKNGLTATTTHSLRNYSSYAAKILQLQTKISEQVFILQTFMQIFNLQG